MLPAMNEGLVGYVVVEDFGKTKLMQELSEIKTMVARPERVVSEEIKKEEVPPVLEVMTPAPEMAVAPPPTLPAILPAVPYIPVTTTEEKKTNWLLLGSLAFLGISVAVYAGKKRGG